MLDFRSVKNIWFYRCYFWEMHKCFGFTYFLTGFFLKLHGELFAAFGWICCEFVTHGFVRFLDWNFCFTDVASLDGRFLFHELSFLDGISEVSIG